MCKILLYWFSFIIHLYWIFDLISIGNILFRPNILNQIVFCPNGILEMLKAPLIYTEFWTTKLFLSNYYIIIGCIFFINKFIN
jgi:hypothetical protein